MPFSTFNSQQKTVACLALFVITAAVFVLWPIVASAQASLGIGDVAETGLGTRDLKEIIVSVIRIILGFLGLVAVAIIIYGGYLWMTAAGNEDRIAQAKRLLVNAAVGLAIILSAYAIVTYIINKMQEATLVREGPPGRDRGFDINIGALGGGILRDVYPEPGARDVPRNTLIMVTFKEEMAQETLLDTDNYEGNCSEGVSCGFLRELEDQPTVRVINRTEGGAVLAARQVVAMTNNNKTFVFDPVQYLGKADGFSQYSVNLTDQINKADGSPAFGLGGYTWSFEVSNVLDLTPPQLESVLPVSPPAVFKNTVVQLNFNEAINVLTATGRATGNPAEPLNTILISYTDDEGTHYMSGQATISNRFRTVEFVSDLPCEVNGQPVEENSCGRVPTCFPGNEDFAVLIKAALVDESGNTTDIFSGITDAAANSLDGNANNQPEGQPEDNYLSNFSTNDELDLTPPEIINISPLQSSSAVAKNSRIRAEFNEFIRSSTLASETYTIFETACNQGPEFPADSSCYPTGGFNVYKQNENNRTTAILRTYYPYLNPLTEYNPRLTAEIQDLYQNCFNPAVGPCAEGQDSPICE